MYVFEKQADLEVFMPMHGLDELDTMGKSNLKHLLAWSAVDACRERHV